MPTKKVVRRKSKTSHSTQKPRGYWDDFANVERELHAFIAQHGTEGVMPTLHELNNSGYSSLAFAIRRHGGLPVVAERLGLRRSGNQKLSGYWDRVLAYLFVPHNKVAIEFSKIRKKI